MKRRIRVKLNYVIVVDDGRGGVPFINVLDLIQFGVSRAIPGTVAIEGGAKSDLTNLDFFAQRRAARAKTGKPTKRKA